MGAYLINNVQPHEKVIFPFFYHGIEEDSPDYLDTIPAATAAAKVGDGYVVYIGDRDMGRHSKEFLWDLCGLS